MKFFWPLADFQVLQKAPETSQREILNCMSSFDMLNYMQSIVGGLVSFLRLYCKIDVANIGILKIRWNSWRFDMSW